MIAVRYSGVVGAEAAQHEVTVGLAAIRKARAIELNALRDQAAGIVVEFDLEQCFGFRVAVITDQQAIRFAPIQQDWKPRLFTWK